MSRVPTASEHRWRRSPPQGAVIVRNRRSSPCSRHADKSPGRANLKTEAAVCVSRHLENRAALVFASRVWPECYFLSFGCGPSASLCVSGVARAWFAVTPREPVTPRLLLTTTLAYVPPLQRRAAPSPSRPVARTSCATRPRCPRPASPADPPTRRFRSSGGCGWRAAGGRG